MTFAEHLSDYMRRSSLSATALARRAGVAPSTVTRCLHSAQTPGDAVLRKLSGALAESVGEEADEIYAVLRESSSGAHGDYDVCVSKLKQLLSELEVTNNELARKLNYDPSYISRILGGDRRPADPDAFFEKCAGFLARRFYGTSFQSAVTDLAEDGRAVTDAKDLASVIMNWLGQPEKQEPPRIAHFLSALDAFDLNDFFQSTHFEEIKVPTAPFQIPTTKSYFGIREMMQAELDFMKSAALSRSAEDVILYSDMPMEEMSKDPEFPKKWMIGLAVLLRKGLRLQNIHDVNRPLKEMLLGLENWIPLYMTGQVSPYYLTEPTDGTFLHIIRSAGTAALTGEAVSGKHENGKYTLYRNREDVAYCRTRARDLLRRALPLMQIYREDREAPFRRRIRKLYGTPGSYRVISSAPPLGTMSPGLLQDILDRCQPDPREARRIFSLRDEMAEFLAALPDGSDCVLELPAPGSVDWENHPVRLPFSEVFPASDLMYTEEEYLRHLEETERFVKAHENLSVVFLAETPFRNIEIRICAGRYVQVSKCNMPTIHFLIYHPKMVAAFEQFRAERAR